MNSISMLIHFSDSIICVLDLACKSETSEIGWKWKEDEWRGDKKLYGFLLFLFSVTFRENNSLICTSYKVCILYVENEREFEIIQIKA